MTWSSLYSWTLFFLSCYLSYELKTLHFIENYKQKQPSRCVFEKRKSVPKICSKFTGEQPCYSAISIKLQSIWTSASVWISNIEFIPLLFTQVSFSRLPKSYRRLKIWFYFHTVLYRCFFFLCLSIFSRFLSTAILLSSSLVKK